MKVYYGWVIVAAGALMGCVAIGVLVRDQDEPLPVADLLEDVLAIPVHDGCSMSASMRSRRSARSAVSS